MNLTDQIPVPLRSRFTRRSEPIVWRKPRWHSTQLVLLGAAVAVVALILLVPAYLILRMAGAGQETVEILSKGSTVTVLLNTMMLAGSVTFAAAFIAVPIAWLTVCTDLPGKRAWAILGALPLVLPSYVAAFVYMTILAPKGLLQQFLEPWTGIDRLPSLMGFPGAFLVLTFVSYPYILLPVRAAFQRMDPSLLEAARSLGLPPRKVIVRVTLPYLRPSIVAGGLLVMLYVLRDFGAVTMWQYSTFTRIIYNRYLSYRLDTAAALALVVVAITIMILLLESRSRGKARYARLSSGAARQLRPVKLGRWLWPVQLMLGSLIFVTLILPTIGLLIWFWRGMNQDWVVQNLAGSNSNLRPLASLFQPALNSLSVSSAAALLAMILALPIAILVVRRPSHLSRLLERLSYIGFALPGIVVALALVFFGIQYAPSLYQTVPVMLAAYMILFIPQSVGSQRASLLQISPGLEEAARSLGKRPLTVFRRVTFPLVLPGVLAGGALVFLTSMKELPAALILSPLGFTTLSTQVWTNINEAFFARAAAPTLLLLLLSSLPLALLTFRGK